MRDAESDGYRTVEEYRVAAEAFARITGFLLFGFARHKLDKKNLIIRNFTARAVTMVRSVMTLWEHGNYHECWIIHRCLIDRYFHLVSLGKDGAYERFDDWSFVRRFDALNRVRSDPDRRGAISSPLFASTADQRERYAALVKAPPQWKRPKAQDVADEKGVRAMYAYGYDYASAHVHPMADEGLEDFYAITKLGPRPDFPSQISVLHNSLLAGCSLVNESLCQSDFLWRNFIFDFYEGMLAFLDNGSNVYISTFQKILAFGPEANACEATSPPVQTP